jgi:polysaccharide export outer membrane protein
LNISSVIKLILINFGKPRLRMISFFRLQLFVLAGLLLGLGGCVTQSKLPYLQTGSYSTQKPLQTENMRPVYKLQAGDVLSIRVQSVQPVLSDIFNVPGPQTITSSDPGTLYLTGYAVDDTGSINLPTVGRVKVQGLSMEEAQAFLQQKVAAYVRDANVLVKLLSFKITVLGEVRSPGRYFIYNPQATVFEALGMAGDLTEFGNRENIKLIRQTPKGSEVVLINLTDANLLKSPYYYLLPNDALYVEPLKARTSRGNATNLGIVFAGISAVVLLLSYIVNK